MGTQFTPGPWDAWDDGRVPEAAEQQLVCKVHSLRNAHLIAAAPELYASLRGLLIALQSDGPFPRESIERAEAAIAKARGDLAEVGGGSK